MDDGDYRQLLSGSEKRAKTLVIRCWHDGSAGEAPSLRGTVRDLSRGRAVPFEGVQALCILLQNIIENGPAERPAE